MTDNSYSIKHDSDKLSASQKVALKTFSKWLQSSELKGVSTFVLSGYAGSGKTFLSIKFLQLVESLNLCWTVAAPTHKAVGVIREAMNTENLKPIWYPSTIHRLLRLRIKRKGDLELCESTDQTQTSLEQLDLVLIDESSMIDSSLLEIILSCAQPYKTRLVFVGDPAQLPPIGENKSPVFSIKKSINQELVEVIRHQGAVLNLANYFREGLIPCNAPPYLPLIKRKNEVVGCVNKEKWLEQAKESLRLASLEDNADGARILCYTNRTLEKLVPHARRAIHGEMAEQLPVLPGEVLISRNAIMAPAACKGGEEEEEPDMVLGSNRELIVNDIMPHRCNLGEFGISNESDWDVPVINTQIITAKAGDKELEIRLLPSVGTESRQLLESTLSRIREKAKAAGKINGKKFWRSFFYIRDAFASLGPAAVLTIHRSQGSSFDQVFVAPDVFWPKDLKLRKQLVYVAVSRARKSVWMVGIETDKVEKNKWQKLLN